MRLCLEQSLTMVSADSHNLSLIQLIQLIVVCSAVVLQLIQLIVVCSAVCSAVVIQLMVVFVCSAVGIQLMVAF